MKQFKDFELPPDLQPVMKKVRKLEYITIAYLISVTVLMYLVMGTSQAMKTAWLEDVLSMLPAISFLIASRIYDRPANATFPYGYHRVFSIAFLTGSVALFGMGLYLAVDSLINLIKMEHPTIGSTFIFGHQIWMGWIMIAALIYSGAPAVWLGYKKLPLAKKLHNKILYTDADTQKADYMTALAAIIGIVGIGFGLWWADALAALFISFSVMKDGYKNLRNAICDLMDRYPVDIEKEKPHPIVKHIEEMVNGWDWVIDSHAKFREEGQVFIGEVQIRPREQTDIIKNLVKGREEILAYHWKIHEVTLTVGTEWEG
ncbi:cation diffusion facilitator family transporter [Aequorivita sp. SDUM287046]|uniref:Cation diffusion facilitator family transporter n=1 Tax=Aequorivita aurantiaca TaxID=3053356 RepID=A0ABT8DJR3_9FLAO|nr:cation diffusion facilitator family transporter [Aequorivita aurantiaca]MDN3724135.1 cation diffusion facilitator family transporter [Aequorivita aurantiaca]